MSLACISVKRGKWDLNSRGCFSQAHAFLAGVCAGREYSIPSIVNSPTLCRCNSAAKVLTEPASNSNAVMSLMMNSDCGLGWECIT
jgi:hypothetical protein